VYVTVQLQQQRFPKFSLFLSPKKAHEIEIKLPKVFSLAPFFENKFMNAFWNSARYLK
jgi:hypothetical protein